VHHAPHAALRRFQEFAKEQPIVAATRVSVFFVIFASWLLTKPKGVLKAR